MCKALTHPAASTGVRVAVADRVQAAEKAAQDENSSKMQSPRALVIGVPVRCTYRMYRYV